ncbi:MAG: hypothetical protein QNK11_04900, partial [Legionella sp.]|nr:hypothetical protein [Legionella sp.]
MPTGIKEKMDSVTVQKIKDAFNKEKSDFFLNPVVTKKREKGKTRGESIKSCEQEIARLDGEIAKARADIKAIKNKEKTPPTDRTWTNKEKKGFSSEIIAKEDEIKKIELEKKEHIQTKDPLIKERDEEKKQIAAIKKEHEKKLSDKILRILMKPEVEALDSTVSIKIFYMAKETPDTLAKKLLDLNLPPPSELSAKTALNKQTNETGASADDDLPEQANWVNSELEEALNENISCASKKGDSISKCVNDIGREVKDIGENDHSKKTGDSLKYEFAKKVVRAQLAGITLEYENLTKRVMPGDSKPETVTKEEEIKFLLFLNQLKIRGDLKNKLGTSGRSLNEDKYELSDGELGDLLQENYNNFTVQKKEQIFEAKVYELDDTKLIQFKNEVNKLIDKIGLSGELSDFLNKLRKPPNVLSKIECTKETGRSIIELQKALKKSKGGSSDIPPQMNAAIGKLDAQQKEEDRKGREYWKELNSGDDSSDDLGLWDELYPDEAGGNSSSLKALEDEILALKNEILELKTAKKALQGENSSLRKQLEESESKHKETYNSKLDKDNAEQLLTICSLRTEIKGKERAYKALEKSTATAIKAQDETIVRQENEIKVLSAAVKGHEEALKQAGKKGKQEGLEEAQLLVVEANQGKEAAEQLVEEAKLEAEKFVKEAVQSAKEEG